MSDISAQPSFYEQLKQADKSRQQQLFIEALDAKAGIQVTSDDILTAAQFSRDELFMVAILALARQRLAKVAAQPVGTAKAPESVKEGE